jgi:tetratricopeptide (TPR) repeat protein
MESTEQYYELLGVPSDIEQKALRKAYFKALKVHPVDKNPSQHQAIRKAYAILNDPQKRKEYDLSREDSGELGELLSDGQKLYEDENYEQALKVLKKSVVLSPTKNGERLLAQCYLHLAQASKALKLIDKLVEENPEDLDLLETFGYSILFYIVRQTSNEPNQMSKEDKQRLLRARDIFESCVEINPEAREGYMGQARVEYFLERYDQAETWCQRAIDCDDEHDFDDFGSYLLKIEVLILQKRYVAVENTTEYVLSLVPDDEGYKDYACGRLIDLALRFYRNLAFEAAGAIFEKVNNFSPNSELGEFVDQTKMVITANRELDQLIEDDDLYNELKRLGIWALWTYVDINESERVEHLEEASKELDKVIGASHDINQNIRAQFNLMKSRYPNLWALQDETFHKIVDLIPSNSLVSHGSHDISTNDGCGCAVLLLAIPILYLLIQTSQYVFS